MPVDPTQTQARDYPPSAVARWEIFLAAAALLFAGLLAYANIFAAPFVHDDAAAIVNNATIQHGLAGALHPPTQGETVMDRPLLNLTFAANYSLGGLKVGGYHAVNLAIHLLAGLALFGLVRRTLELPSLRARWGESALPVAIGAAALWLLHPLQTESVTYTAQRAESLAGLFYLLTFYGFVRAGPASRENYWLMFSALACLLGVFCKETIATVPVLILLYDRAFVAGSLAAAWKQRRQYYLILAATWLLLAARVGQAGNRDGSAGFGTGVSPVDYALTQARAVVLYLRLSFWPHPLVFDYGNGLVKSAGEVAPQLAVVLALLAGTGYLLWKKPGWGFLSAWFLVTLAPSSSFVPIATETMAEHRLYLPLAALAVAVALLINWRGRPSLGLTVAAILAVILGAATYQRNVTYRNAVTLWGDTVQKNPQSARAHENYAVALLNAGLDKQSAEESLLAIELQPNYPEAENNLGNSLVRLAQPEEAVHHFARAAAGLRLPREKGYAYFNLGSVLGQLSHYDYALAAYTQTTQLLPDYPPGHNLRGYVLAKLGRYAEAVEEYNRALQLQPDYPQCAKNLADAQAHLKQPQP